MKSMAFTLTVGAIQRMQKHVTRRIGSRDVRVGDILWAVDRKRGFKRGEKQRKLARIVVTDVRVERLKDILGRPSEPIAEGMEYLSPFAFVEFFCKTMKCKPSQRVRRIQFEYLCQRGCRCGADGCPPPGSCSVAVVCKWCRSCVNHCTGHVQTFGELNLKATRP